MFKSHLGRRCRVCGAVRGTSSYECGENLCTLIFENQLSIYSGVVLWIWNLLWRCSLFVNINSQYVTSKIRFFTKSFFNSIFMGLCACDLTNVLKDAEFCLGPESGLETVVSHRFLDIFPKYIFLFSSQQIVCETQKTITHRQTFYL